MTTSFFDADPREWQTVTDGTVQFALVGIGWWTREYVLPAIKSSDLCTTTAVVSSSPDKVAAVKGAYETVETGYSYDEFLDGPDEQEYDAVYVCTPNATHYEYVAAAAKQGKPVLCEKPMEATVDRARNVVGVCDDYDVPLMVGYRMHTEPAVRQARELVRDGVIGDPVFVHGANSQPLLEMIEDPDQWRLDPALSGYGTSVMDLGIYPINTARFVLDVDPVRVQSMMESTTNAFEDVPDERAAFTVEFEDEIYASCTASQRGHDHTHLEIVGTDGRINLEPAFHMETSLTVEQDGTTIDVETEQVDQMELIFDYFANQILSGESVYADGSHGLVDMRTIKAIHDAAKDGSTVRVESP